MGLYNTVRSGDKEGQVKCWGEDMLSYTIGDKVPNIDEDYSYLVAMREGGYLIVFKNVLIAWEDEIPVDNKEWPIYDKWGSPFFGNDATENSGVLGESYFNFGRK